MIVDYRIYAMAYAILLVGYFGSFAMLARCHPGSADFRKRMDAADRYFAGWVTALGLVAFAHFTDWLWS